MAEGGIAAGLGNLDEKDGWTVHFADTMRGGQMVNNWRMVELYAHEGIDRVYELERWGGLFDRTPDGRILQRAFAALTYPPLCPSRTPTAMQMIPSSQLTHILHPPS